MVPPAVPHKLGGTVNLKLSLNFSSERLSLNTWWGHSAGAGVTSKCLINVPTSISPPLAVNDASSEASTHKAFNYSHRGKLQAEDKPG